MNPLEAFYKLGNNTIVGNEASENITGLQGNDSLYGSGGNDILYGGTGNDALSGDNNNDTLYGGTGNDWLEGRLNNDSLLGEAGNDTLYGGTGNDSLNGGGDNDFLVGGAERDILTGGAGLDRFIYMAKGDSTNMAYDYITDFTPGQDKIDLSVIDANTAMGGDQAFKFVAFAQSGKLGTITYTTYQGNGFVLADNDGVTGWDFVIQMQANLTLGKNDFIL
jgi:Ca2+-binding RTX toxin-like protein